MAVEQRAGQPLRQPGAIHRLQQSTDLVIWSDVQNIIFGAPSGNSITASFPAPAGTRFYAVRP